MDRLKGGIVGKFAAWLIVGIVMLIPVWALADDKTPVNATAGITANEQAPQGTAVPISPADLRGTPDTVPEKSTQVILNEVSVPAVMSAEVPVEVKAVAAVHGPFDRVKTLAGRWEGTGKNAPGDKQDKISVIYQVTAGGNAVMERIFPGTDQEMVTMFYEDKGRLTLLHFCLIGTRSLMSLKPAPAENQANPGQVFEFDLQPNPGLDSAVDTHMHSLKISFVDENHVKEEWEMFEAGKPSGKYTFVLTRIPETKP